jgi:hypothetical protein
MPVDRPLALPPLPWSDEVRAGRPTPALETFDPRLLTAAVVVEEEADRSRPMVGSSKNVCIALPPARWVRWRVRVLSSTRRVSRSVGSCRRRKQRREGATASPSAAALCHGLRSPAARSALRLKDRGRRSRRLKGTYGAAARDRRQLGRAELVDRPAAIAVEPLADALCEPLEASPMARALVDDRPLVDRPEPPGEVGHPLACLEVRCDRCGAQPEPGDGRALADRGKRRKGLVGALELEGERIARAGGHLSPWPGRRGESGVMPEGKEGRREGEG